MFEIVNKLPAKKFQEADEFLNFLGIYEDEKRNQSFSRLIERNGCFIAGRTGVEAGAGLGSLTQVLLDAGAKKVYAVEENSFCAQFLKNRFKSNNKVKVIHDKIENFTPPRKEKMQFLFQELYGPLLLDESLLSLEKIKFDPGIVLPDSGLILGEVVRLEDFNDPTITEDIINLLEGTLVTDLFLNFRFKKPFVIGSWQFRKGQRNYSFEAGITKKGILSLGMEVWHGQRKVSGTGYCFNWPYIFVPVKPGTVNLRFQYSKGLTEVEFRN